MDHGLKQVAGEPFYMEKIGEEKGSFSTNNGNTTINYINGD